MEIAGAVRVSNASRQFLFWVDGALAARFIHDGLALQRGTKRKVRALLWIGETIEPSEEWGYPRVEPVRYSVTCKNPWNCCK